MKSVKPSREESRLRKSVDGGEQTARGRMLLVAPFEDTGDILRGESQCCSGHTGRDDCRFICGQSPLTRRSRDSWMKVLDTCACARPAQKPKYFKQMPLRASHTLLSLHQLRANSIGGALAEQASSATIGSLDTSRIKGSRFL
jgi:hypothetical protein